MVSVDWVSVGVSFKPEMFINVIRNRIYFSKYLRDLCLEKDWRFIEFLKSDGFLGFRFLPFYCTNSLYLHFNSQGIMICYSKYISDLFSKGKHQVLYDDEACVYYIKLS